MHTTVQAYGRKKSWKLRSQYQIIFKIPPKLEKPAALFCGRCSQWLAVRCRRSTILIVTINPIDLHYSKNIYLADYKLFSQ
jgi:hypothetical protein